MNEEDNMKLNWKFDNETKALRADGPGETLYRVLENDMAPGYLCERRDSNKQMSYASWYEEKIPSLEEAMALCQKDAEGQIGRLRAQILDEHRAARQAAMRGSQETTPRSEHEAEGPKFPLESPDKTPAPSLEERVAWLEVAAGRAAMQLPREGDRSLGTMHAEVCARLSALELKTTGLDEPDALKAKWNNRVADRLAALEERVKWSVDARLLTERLDDIGTTASRAASRVEELDGVVKSGVGGYSYDARIDGFMKRLDDIGTTASRAASRVGQLWQRRTHEMKEANKRIGKLEEKWSCSSNAGLEKRLNEVEIIAKSYTYDMGWKIEKLGERLEKLEDKVLPEHWAYIAKANDGLHALETRVTELEPYGDEPPGFYYEQIEKINERLSKLEEAK